MTGDCGSKTRVSTETGVKGGQGSGGRSAFLVVPCLCASICAEAVLIIADAWRLRGVVMIAVNPPKKRHGCLDCAAESPGSLAVTAAILHCRNYSC